MSREWTIYVRDMVACCDRILTYTEGVSRKAFDQRGMVFDATVRNLELLGEAAIVVSFALESGVHRVFEHFRDLLARGGRLRILTGDYLGITEPNAWIWGRPGWTKVVHYWRDIHDRART